MNEEQHWDYVDCLQHSIQTPPCYMDDHTVGGGRDWLATTFLTAMAVSVVVVAYAVMTWGAR